MRRRDLTGTQSFFASFLPEQATPTPIPAIKRLHPGGSVDSGEKAVLDLFSSADTAPNANCVTIDKNGTVWVCDPENGQVLYIDSSDG